MPLSNRPRGEAGETLLELLISIVILAVCVAAIGGGVVISVKTSRIHKEQSIAQQYLKNYAESIANSYTACSGSTPPNYVSVGSFATPPGFSPPTAVVNYWVSGTATWSTTTACPGTDPGLQRVLLSLNSVDTFVAEKLIVVVRKAA